MKYSRMEHTSYSFKFFKGCLPQILLDPFLYTLTHILLQFYHFTYSKQKTLKIRLLSTITTTELKGFINY